MGCSCGAVVIKEAVWREMSAGARSSFWRMREGALWRHHQRSKMFMRIAWLIVLKRRHDIRKIIGKSSRGAAWPNSRFQGHSAFTS